MTGVIVRRESLYDRGTKPNSTANDTIQNLHVAHSEALLHSLNALRSAQKLFDVTFIVEGRIFKAHRVVLAACSDYFCAMFNHSGFSESRQSEIQLNGISAHGFELLLEYAYTAKLVLNANNVQDVLAASTHVQMKEVIDICSNFLEAQIDLENFVAIACLADLYALDMLKKKVYRYICSQLSEFESTAEFKSLNWEQLKYILSSNYPVDCTEKSLLRLTLNYCREKSLSYYGIACLLRHIRFHQIDIKDVNSFLNNFNDCNSMIIKILNSEIMKEKQKQIQRKLKHNSDFDLEDTIPTDLLINTRGMELALIKIGGFETNGLTNQISCFLPSKGKWEDLTVIPHIEQCNYGTAVLGNDLFVVGGAYDVSLKEYIHPFGFRYCARKNAWTTMAPMRADRCRFSLNAVGTNYLYAVGGVCEINEHGGLPSVCNDSTFNCERYNAAEDRWEHMPPLQENRSQHAGVVVGDKLYISGGFDRHVVLSSLWCFDTTTNTWQQLSSMPMPRADHSLIALGNRIYACGGWFEDPETETRVLADYIDVYDVNTNEWVMETINPMPTFYTGVAAIKNRIYFIGGLLSHPAINRTTSTVQCYDVDKQKWTCNTDWEYPKKVWECTCAAFYIPREHNDLD